MNDNSKLSDQYSNDKEDGNAKALLTISWKDSFFPSIYLLKSSEMVDPCPRFFCTQTLQTTFIEDSTELLEFLPPRKI